MAYICIQKIDIPEVDGDNNTLLTTVPCEIGSEWILADEPADDLRDIRLWSTDGNWWIDVSAFELNNYFSWKQK